MTEPVGNGPRGAAAPIITGNSLRDRDSGPKAEDTKDPIEKVVEGKVVTRKPAWYKRAARNMIAEDAQHVGDFLMVDIVVPAAKNLIRDLVVGGLDRTLFGRSQINRRPGLGIGGNVESLRTRYDQMSGPGEPRKMLSRESRANHDFREVVLDEREEGIMVVEALIARILRYGSASVADLYTACGVTGSYADRNYGWRNLDSADVVQARGGGWLLDLPLPELLR